jgi:hypothetical protein
MRRLACCFGCAAAICFFPHLYHQECVQHLSWPLLLARVRVEAKTSAMLSRRERQQSPPGGDRLPGPRTPAWNKV